MAYPNRKYPAPRRERNVYYDITYDLWRVQFGRNYKDILVGRFKTFEAAVKCRNKWLKQNAIEPIQEAYLTSPDVCERLNIPLPTFYSYLSTLKWQPTTTTMGGMALFTEKDVAKFALELAERRVARMLTDCQKRERQREASCRYYQNNREKCIAAVRDYEERNREKMATKTSKKTNRKRGEAPAQTKGIGDFSASELIAIANNKLESERTTVP